MTRDLVPTGGADTERPARSTGGVPHLLGALVGLLAGIPAIVVGGVEEEWLLLAAAIVVVLAALVVAVGLYTLQPNQSAVLTLFGDYRGTDRTTGLRWANPLYRTRKVSLRVRNFTTETSKVNDANGNPIQIAAVVVWRVVDTAKASFGVDDFVDYVRIQSEAAVRHLARSYPYDSFEDEPGITLIDDVETVNASLHAELQERVAAAGVDVIEARLTDLSYAPEIAEVMLRRQQAAAVVAARKKIVEGAVTMVREAIAELEAGDDSGDPIPLDADRRATFASNLMTVIASDQPTNPIVNVGTLSR